MSLDQGDAHRGAEQEADASAGDAADLALLDLVYDHDTSVRLRNSVANAVAAGSLPYRTVREYVAAGPAALPTMCRKVRSFGRKSARELEELVRSVARAQLAEPRQGSADAPDCPRALLLDQLDGVTLEQALDGEILSTRLDNALSAAPEIREIPLRLVADDFESVRAALWRRPNVGRRSVGEFEAVVRRAIARKLLEAGAAPEQAAEDSGLLLNREAEGVEAERAIQIVVEPEPKLHFAELREALEWLMEGAPERSIEVIRRRYGIDGPDETLEEIGRTMRVTRERVRQIEFKTLQRMRLRSRRLDLKRLLTDAARPFWDDVSEGTHLFEPKLSIKDRPYLHLALDVAELRCHDWLSGFAVRTDHGWLSPDLNEDELLEARNQIAAALQLPLPRPVPPGPDGQARLTGAIAEVEHCLPPRDGYLAPPRAGPRLRRLMRLHILLAGAGRPVPVGELTELYRAVHGDDNCTARDVTIVLEAAPHLAIETVEGSWCALGSSPAAPEPPTQPAPRRDAQPDEDTIAWALVRTLEQRGPQRLSTLYQEAAAILPAGRSANSVGPILIMRPDLFLRLLPGVYGLHSQVPSETDVLESPPDYLLDDWQLRLFALGRRASESCASFPLWTPAAEFALLRWARHNGRRDFYRSMLTVAEIDAWPIGESERERWRAIAREERRWELSEALCPGLAYVLPSLPRLLAACIETQVNARLSWITCNRLTGRRLDSQRGVEILVALLAAGALLPGEDWQSEHRPGPALHAVRILLEREMHRSGSLSWCSGAGRDLLRRMHEGLSEDLGWIDRDAVATILESPPEGIEELSLNDIDLLEPPDPLEMAVREHRRDRESKRREDLLQWLLEE